MNRLTLTFEFPADGGTVLYSDSADNAEMQLVFAGNQSEALDYVAKRVGFYASNPPKRVANPNEFLEQDPGTKKYRLKPGYEIPYSVDEANVADFRRTGAIA